MSQTAPSRLKESIGTLSADLLSERLTSVAGVRRRAIHDASIGAVRRPQIGKRSASGLSQLAESSEALQPRLRVRPRTRGRTTTARNPMVHTSSITEVGLLARRSCGRNSRRAGRASQRCNVRLMPSRSCFESARTLLRPRTACAATFQPAAYRKAIQYEGTALRVGDNRRRPLPVFSS